MPNLYNNKVELSDGTTLIDLTSDTGGNDNIIAGTVIHTASGEQITGDNLNVNDTTEPDGVTPTPVRILTGYKVWCNGTELTGTMSNHSNYGINDETRLGPHIVGITDKNYNDGIPNGYHYGSKVTIATAEKNKIIERNIKDGVTILGVPGSFTSDGTAAASDIYKDETAYVGGSKVTGTYKMVTAQRNSGSGSSSTTQLVVSCSFSPSAVAVVYNNNTYTNNKIIACFGISSGITWQSKTSSGCAFTSITENVENYWYYSGGNVYIKAPPSVYTWASNNYRVFCFR